ncbi:MAG: TetR/AcrR family transcriptional regulator [Pseudomonadota bacterium]
MSKEQTRSKRGRPRSAAARDAVLTAARAILDEGGAAALTIEAVAARAGVGKPTIYRQWANAQELSMAAMMTAEPPASDPPDGGALAGLAALAEATVDRLASPSGRRMSQLLASADTDSELFKAFRNHVALESRERARGLIAAAQNDGALAADLDVDLALDMIFGAIFLRVLLRHEPLAPGFGASAVALIAPPPPSAAKRRRAP